MMRPRYFLPFAFVFIFMLSFYHLPANAFDKAAYYEPITEISLNVRELTLNVGEQYKLPVTYAPAETPAVFLKWYMDEKTVQIDPETLTITALSAGKTRLMTESIGGFAWDFCDITVLGTVSKEAAGQKAGSELIALSGADKNKIKAETVLRYLDFIESSSFTPEDYERLAERRFYVTAIVNPETVSAQSELAASLGMDKALELPDFHAVSLHGTLAQILDFAESNDDLAKLIEFAPLVMDDPLPEQESRTTAKSMNLKDNVEELTSVSTAHDLGLKGDGTVIAIFDSGLNKNHEQFSGRVIAEYCAPLADDDDSDDEEHYAVCTKGSSEPSRAQNKAEYNHGSHTAGIAAGRDGIAPHADIISISNAAEYCQKGDCLHFLDFDIMEVSQYLINLQKEYKAAGKPQIVAVNMSFGKNKKYSGSCDEAYEDFKEAFDLLVENDIIPVVSSGNDGYNDGMPAYRCLSGSFAVGALADDPNPMIRSSSNHGQMVDILAPGTRIWSALYVKDDKPETICSGINCYGYRNGTSMAAPMVAGAFAILKQANPNLTVSELESQIRDMSSKTANYKPETEKYSEHTFDYDKPVLDFSDIENYIYRPEPEPPHIPYFWPIDMPVLPRTGFSLLHSQILPSMPADLKYTPLEMMLEIPGLDVLSDMVEIPVIDNEYAVTWLGDTVGLLAGSAQPGQGTTILAAHNHLNNTENGPFILLSSMEEGDRVFIRDSENNLQIYAVYANEKVPETDFKAVDRIAGAFENALIMITCEDERVSGGYDNRRVVAAKRVL